MLYIVPNGACEANQNYHMKNKTKRSKLLAMYLLVVLILLLTVQGVGQLSKDILNKQEYEITKTFEGCHIDCGDVEPFDYEAVLASERLQQQLENRIKIAERRERARLARLESERLKRLEEKKKEGLKKQVVSRGSGYQSTFETTFYTSSCRGCTGQSASGEWVNKSIYYQGYRVVAAPPHIKFYTKLRIRFEDGTVMDAIVLDRGSDIQGKRLDILVGSKDEAYRLGRQQVKVEIIN